MTKSTSEPSTALSAEFIAGSRAALAELATRVAALAPAKAVAPPAPGGFGATQRWTLTRLGFAPRDPSAPRVLIARPTFIAAADLAKWRHAPPPEAHALPASADAIVDGVTPEDATCFYAVLEASSGAVAPDAPEASSAADAPPFWDSLPLMPLAPPFDTAHAPFVLGPAAARIRAFAAKAPPSPELAALIEAALRGLA